MGVISVIQSPGEIALSRNPLIYKFRVLDENGDPYGPKGIRAELRMTGDKNIPIGKNIEVYYETDEGYFTSVKFFAVATPTAEDEIPGDPTGYGSYIEYWAAVAEKMQAHHQIAPHFRVYAETNVGTGHSLWMEALEISNDWVLNMVHVTADPDFEEFTYDTIVADNTPDDYVIRLDIMLEETYNSGNFVRLVQLQQAPDADGWVTFNMQDVIHPAVENTLADPPIPSWGTDEITKADVLRRYYVRYQESFDGNDPGAWTYEDIKLVLCGGVAQNLFADYNFFDAFSADNSLLTWYPDGKTVSTDQPEYLAWINYTGADAEVNIELRRYTATGALSTLYRYGFNGLVLAPWEIALIPVGYTEINVASTAVKKYSVRVVDDNSDWEGAGVEYFSQTRNFYVDYNHYEEKRYLMYLNGFCLPQTLRCIGDFSDELEVDRLPAQRILTPDYTATTAELFQFDQDFRNFFTYRSGYLTRFEVDALQEMLIYNRLWEVYDEGYIPLTITDKKYQITTTRQYLHATQFVAVPALQRKNYSNINIPLEISQQSWQTVAGDYWKTVFGLTWKIAP